MTGGMEWDGAGALVAAAACVSQVKEGDCNTEKPMWAAHGGLDFNGREAWDQWDKMQVRQLFWHPLVAFERLSPHVTPGTHQRRHPQLQAATLLSPPTRQLHSHLRSLSLCE